MPMEEDLWGHPPVASSTLPLGLIVMTAELEAAGKSLFVNEVPEMPLEWQGFVSTG